MQNIIKDLEDKVQHILNFAEQSKLAVSTDLENNTISSLWLVAEHFKEDISVFLNIFVSMIYNLKILNKV